MRAFISFWIRCVQIAFLGSTAFANDWQWLVGIPICAFLAQFIAGHEIATANITGNRIVDAVLVALAAFIVTWVFAFAARLINAPVQLDREKNEIIKSMKFKLETFGDQRQERHSRLTALSRLAQLISDGERIANSRETGDTIYKHPHADRDIWRTNVLDILQKHFPEIVIRFGAVRLSRQHQMSEEAYFHHDLAEVKEIVRDIGRAE